MKKRVDARRVSIVLATAAMTLAMGRTYAMSQDQMLKLAKMGAQFAANNARVASEVCGVDQAAVSKYKDGASKQFAQDRDFASDWDLGWKNAARTIDGLRQMKTSDAKEYEQHRAAICSDMRRQMKS